MSALLLTSADAHNLNSTGQSLGAESLKNPTETVTETVAGSWIIVSFAIGRTSEVVLWAACDVTWEGRAAQPLRGRP